LGTAHAGDIARRNHRALASIQMPARKVQICTTPGFLRPAATAARKEQATTGGRDGDRITVRAPAGRHTALTG